MCQYSDEYSSKPHQINYFYLIYKYRLSSSLISAVQVYLFVQEGTRRSFLVQRAVRPDQTLLEVKLY